MSITFDADSESALQQETPLVWNHTIGSSSNKLLVVLVFMHCVAGFSGEAVSSITFAGIALTLAVTANYSVYPTTNWLRASIYYLIDPPVGTSAISVSFSGGDPGNLAWKHGKAVSFFGVTPTLPLGTTNTKSGWAINKSINITTVANSSVLIDSLIAAGGIQTPTTGQVIIGTSTYARAGGRRVVGVAGSYTDTWNGPMYGDYAFAIAEFKAEIIVSYDLSVTDGIKVGDSLSALMHASPLVMDGIKVGSSINQESGTFLSRSEVMQLADHIKFKVTPATIASARMAQKRLGIGRMDINRVRGA